MSYHDAKIHGETNAGLGMVGGATEEDRLYEENHKLRQQLATVTEHRDRLLAALRVNGLACETCRGSGNNIKPGFQCFDCNGSGLNDEAKSYDRKDIAESRGSEHHE